VYRKILALIAALLTAFAPPLPAHAAVTPQSQLTCQYLLNTWPTGFTADLLIFNNGPTIDGWTATWTFDTPSQLVAVWSADMNQSTATVAVATPMPWNKIIASGSAVVFGWTALAPKTEVPDDITVNGIPC